MHPNSHDPNQPHGAGNYVAPSGFDRGIQSQGGYGQAPQAGYGGFAQPQAVHAHAHVHEAGTIVCPKCQKPSDSVKAYTMMSFLLFIFIGAWWRTKKVVACSGCMRNELLISTAINTVSANVLSPIVWIWHGVLFAMTFGEGHSPEVIGYLR